MKCEWSRNGYCECYGTTEEQEERETNWPCGGTEAEMQECGQIENLKFNGEGRERKSWKN